MLSDNCAAGSTFDSRPEHPLCWRGVDRCFSGARRTEKLFRIRSAAGLRDSKCPASVPGKLIGPHVILFFISSRTGMMVKRPAIGAEGFVLDHFDRGQSRITFTP